MRGLLIHPLWALAGIALLGTAGVTGALVVAPSGGEEEATGQLATDTPFPASTAAETPEPTELSTPRDETKWLPGLPIDTPPAEETPVFSSPPAGEEGQWQAIADWARSACRFDGGVPDLVPAAMFKTTAGEIRRRNADIAPDGTALGSNWHNQDTVYIVAYRGDYPMRPGPPLPGNQTPRRVPNGNMCTYLGNGRTDDWDNGSVGHWTLNDTPDSIDELFP